MINLMLGDCLEKLKELEDSSIDSVVTDPPYGLSFMGKKWDYDVPSVEIWKECLRVLKPGGHLLSFGGTRTYHRMVINIEDAGFEIRDQIMWIYGSGFPKSHNIAKSIDREIGVKPTVVGKIKAPASTKNVTTMGRPEHSGSGWNDEPDLTEPTSDSAKQWQGWGTALKPANEPICLARKPISKKTVASNVLKHGTGAMNIDESRIQTEDNLGRAVLQTQSWKNTSTAGVGSVTDDWKKGRWPANVIFDEEVGQDQEWSRFFYCAKTSKAERNAGLEGMPTKKVGTYAQDEWSRNNMGNTPDSKREGVQNFHPTVKPIKLMTYLIKLITPPGGVVLDPFMGSGSTGIAAKKLFIGFVGIERDSDYFNIASARINRD